MRLALRKIDATYRTAEGMVVNPQGSTLRIPATSHDTRWAGVTLPRGFSFWHPLARRNQSVGILAAVAGSNHLALNISVRRPLAIICLV